jgi:hypothetical protein
VCDALGGELNFAARPEGGTVITMQLPAWRTHSNKYDSAQILSF